MVTMAAPSQEDPIAHVISFAPEGGDGMTCVQFPSDTPLSEVALSLAGIALVIDDLTRNDELRGSTITNIDGQPVEIRIPGLEFSDEARRADLAKSIEEFLIPEGSR